MNNLNHSGIKGQKWGIRNYQYEDGSFTEEGKIRYGRVKRTTTAREKSRMTDDELKERIARLKLEKELKGLEQDTMSEGRKFMKDVGVSVAKKTLTQLVPTLLYATGVTTVNKYISKYGDKAAVKDLVDEEKAKYETRKENWEAIRKGIPTPKDSW